MKKILLVAVILGMTIAPVNGQTKKEINVAKKEASAAAKTLKKEGYKMLELGSIEPRLQAFFLKVQEGNHQIVGTADGCKSLNLAKVTAMANAANEYATLEGGVVRGRIISGASNLSGEQLDNIVAGYERLVQKEIRGELNPYVTAVRESKGDISVRLYCVVDVESAFNAKKAAMEQALKEQDLADEYGSKISEWVRDGFSGNGKK